ncbi:alpha/beta hydrolase [uncultured Algibacter sp.]|uniref:alpha/beta fold hydrolase n=1 Tax=uncultured Algibacter sp. TaxID=298659 RepID=UPI002630B901|nr:alpha/beta hydrolase [uncultured Algibacter sp.]
MILEYKGVNIFYTDNGHGKTVVFLHGFLENSSIWNPFIPELAKNNRIICIDLLGHGKTECMGYIHTMETMAEAVQAVLEHLKIKEAILVGHSMGGYVALAFAEKYLNLTKGIALVNSTSKADSAEKKTNRDRAIAAVKHDYKTFVRIAISNLFNPDKKSSLKKEITTIINNALKTPLQGIIAALEGMKIRKERTDILQNFKHRKMLIASREDPVLNYKSLLEEAKKTGVKVVKFPDGHMSLIENEALFFQNIMYFIEN